MTIKVTLIGASHSNVSPRGFGEVPDTDTLLSYAFPIPHQHSPRQAGFLMVSPNLPVLQRLPRIGTFSSDFNDQLIKVLYEEEYVQCLENLEGDDLAWLVDYLDKVRSHEPPPPFPTQASVGARCP